MGVVCASLGFVDRADSVIRRQHRRQCLCDLPLHFLDIVLHGDGAFLGHLGALRALDESFFHAPLSSLIENLLNLLILKYCDKSKSG